MSWSITVAGKAEQIGNVFDEQRERSAAAGMIEQEQRDIDEARDLAVTFAEKYGAVSVYASGHWTVYSPGDHRNQFGRVSVTIEKISDEG